MPERDPVATIRGELQIGQVARQTGHTAVTLRHWEKTGLLDPPPRRGGKRRYPPSVLTRIALIDLARHAGFSLAEIRELLTAPDPGLPAADCWRALVTRKLAETDSLMACLRDRQRLLEDLLACHCPRLEDCAMQRGATAGDQLLEVPAGEPLIRQDEQSWPQPGALMFQQGGHHLALPQLGVARHQATDTAPSGR